MRTYDPRSPLISIHVPKCAGTSLKKVLSDWFGKNFRFHYFDEKNNRKPEKHDLTAGFLKKKYKEKLCIHGHFNKERGFGIADYYPEANQFITILRDPFEIHLSNYFFVKSLHRNAFRDGRVLEFAVDEAFDLERYLEKPRSYLLMHFPDGIDQDNYREFLEDHFVYIGIVEDLQASMDRLADRLGFPPVRVPLERVSERSEAAYDGAREKFIALNPLEWKIYEYARSRYKE